MVTSESQEYLLEMRARVQREGHKSVTDEELERAINILRDGRIEAMEKPRGTRTRKSGKAIAMSDEELGSIFDGV